LGFSGKKNRVSAIMEGSNTPYPLGYGDIRSVVYKVLAML